MSIYNPNTPDFALDNITKAIKDLKNGPTLSPGDYDSALISATIAYLRELGFPLLAKYLTRERNEAHGSWKRMKEEEILDLPEEMLLDLYKGGIDHLLSK